MRLTKNFSLEEFTFSQTAARKNIFNEPNVEQKKNIKLLCEKVLEPLRDKLGKPIHILSGYRSKDLNKAVGGAARSQHLEGKAADIYVDGMTTKDLFNFIKENFPIGTDQCIKEFPDSVNGGWVHISFNGMSNRNEFLLAFKVGNKIRYAVA